MKKYIDGLMGEGVTRGQRNLIKIVAEKIASRIRTDAITEADRDEVPPAASTIQRWWKRYDRSGQQNYSLLSGNANRRRNRRTSDDEETAIDDAIDEFYAIRERPSKSAAYADYAGQIRLDNRSRKEADLPLIGQVSERCFRDRISARPQYDLDVARHGREGARKMYRVSKGHLFADHPLDVVEIDHSPLNLYVLDDISFIPLGRPWLTALKDRKTKVNVGFYVSFQPTGLNSIFGALKHSLNTHQFAYDMWPDLENPWPFGRAACYASDRGADFRSSRYRSAILDLGASFELEPARTPWAKGSVERYFETLEQSLFETMPGKTFARFDLRGDYKPEKDAVVRFSTLIYLLHKWAVDHHNVLPAKRTDARPIDLWMDAIGDVPPPYPCCVDELNVILGRSEQGTLSHEGIRFKWLTYADNQLEELLRRVGPGTRLDFTVMEEDLGYIYVKDPVNAREPLRIPCTRLDYASGLSLFQHQFLRKEAGVRLHVSDAADVLAETRNRMREVINDELASKNTASKARHARYAGINSNSTLNGESRTVGGENPFTAKKTGEPKRPGEAFTNVPIFSWGTA
jgi:putative transposase